ncbi:hypothetical protein [Roseivirga pacifica]
MKKTQSTGGALGDLHFEYINASNSKIFNTEKLLEATKEEAYVGEGEVSEIIVFVSGKSEYHSHTKKESGIALDFGFCSFGHSSETESDVKNDSRYVHLLIQSKKRCKKNLIENADIKDLMNDEAKKIFEDAPYEFYKRYGSYYANQYYTGLHARLLLTLECNSSEEAEGKKSEWQASFKDDDASGKASLSNNNGFQSFCSRNGVIEKFDHNLSDEIIKEFKKDKKDNTSSLKEHLMLIESMSEFDESDAKHIEAAYTRFDFPKEQFDQILSNNRDINDYNLMKEYELSEFVLNQIDEFEANKSNYQEITNINDVKKYHTKKANAIAKLIRHLNEDLENHEDDLRKDILSMLEGKDDLNKKLMLVKKKLSLQLDTTDTTDDISNLFDELKRKSQGKYNPKIALSEKVAKGHHAYGVVISNKSLITPSRNAPNSDTKWAYKSFSQKSDAKNKHQGSKDLVEWMTENLSPNQYLHCSITRVDKENSGAKTTVFYPEI